MARGPNSIQKCFQGLREACDDALLPYRTVPRFREGRDTVQDNLRTGRLHMDNNTVQLPASLLNVARLWTARELEAEVEVGLFHKTVLHILGYRKLSALWKPHEISRCNNNTAM